MATEQLRRRLHRGRKAAWANAERRDFAEGDLVCVQRDDGHIEERIVKYAPWKCCDGRWLVGLVGITGGYALERCRLKRKEHDHELRFD